jgi:hypothetical protein
MMTARSCTSRILPARSPNSLVESRILNDPQTDRLKVIQLDHWIYPKACGEPFFRTIIYSCELRSLSKIEF